MTVRFISGLFFLTGALPLYSPPGAQPQLNLPLPSWQQVGRDVFIKGTREDPNLWEDRLPLAHRDVGKSLKYPGLG